ncbi:DUF192 domain-containing protein [Candidatus Micrarchaeota archaeon]|nr:DUF192 domain-containing protein [Candidatus Micrarchaeota archaeon]
MGIIKNITKKRILFEDFELAATPWQKTKGIMLRKNLLKPVLFILKKASRSRAAIHSFFCYFEFDAVFLDEKKRIVDIRTDIPPFQPFIRPKKAAKYIIEAPAGSAKKLDLKIGDKLLF